MLRSCEYVAFISLAFSVNRSTIGKEKERDENDSVTFGALPFFGFWIQRDGYPFWLESIVLQFHKVSVAHVAPL